MRLTKAKTGSQQELAVKLRVDGTAGQGLLNRERRRLLIGATKTALGAALCWRIALRFGLHDGYTRTKLCPLTGTRTGLPSCRHLFRISVPGKMHSWLAIPHPATRPQPRGRHRTARRPHGKGASHKFKFSSTRDPAGLRTAVALLARRNQPRHRRSAGQRNLAKKLPQRLRTILDLLGRDRITKPQMPFALCTKDVGSPGTELEFAL